MESRASEASDTMSDTKGVIHSQLFLKKLNIQAHLIHFESDYTSSEEKKAVWIVNNMEHSIL